MGCHSSRPQLEYVGSLEPELAADISSYYTIQMKPLTREQKERFSAVIPNKSTAFVGDLMPPFKDLNTQMLLVDPLQGAPSLYLDPDRNASWASKDGLLFTPCKDSLSPGDSQVSFKLPLPKGFSYRSFPVVIRRPSPVKYPAWGKMGTLLQTRGVCAQGVVDIGGQKTLVQYDSVDLQTGKIDPSNGWLGIDGNGDGRIDFGPFSPEYGKASNESVVFRVGKKYVSTKSVDTVSG